MSLDRTPELWEKLAQDDITLREACGNTVRNVTASPNAGIDPNVVRLKDGSYRGYTKDRDGATIVFSSRDGLEWERLGVAFQDERYRNATDSDVFETPDGSSKRRLCPLPFGWEHRSDADLEAYAVPRGFISHL